MSGGVRDPQAYPSPLVTVDARGEVQAIWRKRTDKVNWGLYGRRFVPAAGWGPQVTITARPGLAAGPEFSLGATDDGRGVAVWLYSDYNVPPVSPDVRAAYASFLR